MNIINFPIEKACTCDSERNQVISNVSPDSGGCHCGILNQILIPKWREQNSSGMWNIRGYLYFRKWSYNCALQTTLCVLRALTKSTGSWVGKVWGKELNKDYSTHICMYEILKKWKKNQLWIHSTPREQISIYKTH